MNYLKDKQQKGYTSLSRYSSFPFYYHTKDNKYIYGLTSHLRDDIEYVLVKIKQRDTLDTLSLKYYGRPDYFWIIADFNRISDPYEKLFGNYEYLKIPSISQISFK